MGEVYHNWNRRRENTRILRKRNQNIESKARGGGQVNKYKSLKMVEREGRGLGEVCCLWFRGIERQDVRWEDRRQPCLWELTNPANVFVSCQPYFSLFYNSRQQLSFFSVSSATSLLQSNSWATCQLTKFKLSFWNNLYLHYISAFCLF